MVLFAAILLVLLGLSVVCGWCWSLLWCLGCSPLLAGSVSCVLLPLLSLWCPPLSGSNPVCGAQWNGSLIPVVLLAAPSCTISQCPPPGRFGSHQHLSSAGQRRLDFRLRVATAGCCRLSLQLQLRVRRPGADIIKSFFNYPDPCRRILSGMEVEACLH